MLRSDNFSLLQASTVTIAEPSLPLLISSPPSLTAWWCRFIWIIFRVWLLHLRSMCGALSDPLHRRHVAGPVVWLNRLVCFSVCIMSVLYLRTCSCFISHIWHGPKFVTELGLSKGLCIRLLCVRVGLCCALGRIMQLLPELVKQCICVSFTKVMVGVHVML